MAKDARPVRKPYKPLYDYEFRTRPVPVDYEAEYAELATRTPNGHA